MSTALVPLDFYTAGFDRLTFEIGHLVHNYFCLAIRHLAQLVKWQVSRLFGVVSD